MPLVVPDQKVTVNVWLNAVVHGGECSSGKRWIEWGCVPVDTPTLKSIEVQNGGLSVKDSTLEVARSLLFIEVGECRAVVRHTCYRRL